MGDEGKFDLPNSKIQSIANPWVGPGRGLWVILRYSRSIENNTPFSHIHDRVRSLNSLWDPPWMWEEGASFLCTPRVPKYFPWLITYLDCVYSHHFFFFSVWALIDSMNNFNVKFPWLLKMVLGIENLDYIKKKKSVFLIIKQRIYLLTKEYCYKYCPLGTCEKCLIAKYHTHILHK